jgi:hypothetical protein
MVKSKSNTHKTSWLEINMIRVEAVEAVGNSFFQAASLYDGLIRDEAANEDAERVAKQLVIASLRAYTELAQGLMEEYPDGPQWEGMNALERTLLRNCRRFAGYPESARFQRFEQRFGSIERNTVASWKRTLSEFLTWLP